MYENRLLGQVLSKQTSRRIIIAPSEFRCRSVFSAWSMIKDLNRRFLGPPTFGQAAPGHIVEESSSICLATFRGYTRSGRGSSISFSVRRWTFPVGFLG